MLLGVWECMPDKRQHTEVVKPAYDSLSVFRMDSFLGLAKSGDLIFRSGNDETSHAARQMSRIDTSFSHCGIVIKENSQAYVFHSIGGADNPSGRLLKQPIDQFCNLSQNNSFAIYRLSSRLKVEAAIKSVVNQYYIQGLTFDLYYNLRTDHAMYCSEFVAKSLNSAYRLSGFESVFLDVSGLGVTVDDIFLNPACYLIKKEVFSIHTKK